MQFKDLYAFEYGDKGSSEGGDEACRMGLYYGFLWVECHCTFDGLKFMNSCNLK